MKRKIAAILAADVVGYSRLVVENETRALEHLLACREIFRDFVERGGGRIFNTAGDAVLAEFPSAVEAVLAGIDIQDCLKTHYAGQTDGFRMQFRMGMTIGDVVEREGDLLGDGVNVAARLEGLADPGGICISANMYEQVINKVAVRFRDLGMKNVKNIPSPVHVYVLEQTKEVLKRKPNVPSWTSSPWAKMSAVMVGLTLVIGGTLIGRAYWGAVLSAKAAGAGQDGSREVVGSPGIYGVPRPTTKAGLSATAQLFDPAGTPFISDADRLKITRLSLSNTSHSALVLSDIGDFGFSTMKPNRDLALSDASALCAKANRGECQTYEIDGIVLWPRPLPLPHQPWIDPRVKRSPFDLGRLRGLSPAILRMVVDHYATALNVKALVMGPTGSVWWRTGRASEEEAMRVDLELCANHEGVPCRVVAVDDQYVVDDTLGPVGSASDPGE